MTIVAPACPLHFPISQIRPAPNVDILYEDSLSTHCQPISAETTQKMESEYPAEQDEHLSETTARLSISINEEGVISQVREFLQEQKPQRRDSAVSITSIDENVPFKKELLAMSTKRRRSSVQTAHPTKKLKEHKRKLRKQNEPLKIEVSAKSQTPMNHSITHLREFLQEAVLQKENSQKKILRVSKLKEVTKVVVAIVPGLLLSDFDTLPSQGNVQPLDPKGSHNESLPFFSKTFEGLLPTAMASSRDTVFPCPQAIVSFPVSKREKRQREEELRKKKIVLYDLLTTLDQMKASNYPIHSSLDEKSLLDEGWVETTEFDHEGSHTFALDCEFCQAECGPVLTRVSMVNFQDEVIYDTYVKPKEEITDYVTKFSGITPEMLENVTTTAQDVQKRILELVSSSDILIGHSLESDLNVMKIKHPNVIDTAVIYHHNRGPPLRPSLKWLASLHLDRLIQQGERTGAGHSSVEDLRACLDLVKLKLLNGPDFGKVIRETTIFEKVYEKLPAIRSVIVDFSPEIYGPDLGENINVEKITVFNDDEIVEAVDKEIDSSSLMFIRFKEVDFNSSVVQVPSRFTGKLFSELDENRKSNVLTGENRKECLKRLNDRLQKVYKRLPLGTVFVVCSEGGDMVEVSQLQAVRRRFQQLERKLVSLSDIPAEDFWDFDKQTALKKASKEARLGLSFATIVGEESSQESSGESSD